MKTYLHKLTALKIIVFFSTVIEMPGNVLIKKPGTFYCSIGCKKGLSRQLNFRKRNIEFTPDKTHASCAGFADRLVGKHRTWVAYNVLLRLKVHKYWSKKIFKLPRIKFFPHWFALPAWGKGSEVTRICILFECCKFSVLASFSFQ